jgi:hypothetical protein
MSEPQVHDSPTPAGPAAPERRRVPRSVMPPPDHRTAAVFPYQHEDQPARAAPAPSRIRELWWEAISQPRNLVPLGLIVILAIVGIGVLVSALTQPAPPPVNAFLARLVVSSSQPATSLFANDRYLGEIGPEAREFVLVPGPLRLRLVRSYCRATDTTLELKVGARVTVGPLDPNCGRT